MSVVAPGSTTADDAEGMGVEKSCPRKRRRKKGRKEERKKERKEKKKLKKKKKKKKKAEPEEEEKKKEKKEEGKGRRKRKQSQKKKISRPPFLSSISSKVLTASKVFMSFPLKSPKSPKSCVCSNS